MNPLSALKTLYEQEDGIDLPLPAELKKIYGRLLFPSHSQRPYVLANFVTTLDGVASLNVPGHAAGGDISGFNAHDRFVMGLLRAVADAVIVGAGTMRSVPDHLWTAEYIFRPFTETYTELRASLGKSGAPLNVIVTASGNIDAHLRVFQSNDVPVLIVTTVEGAARVRQQELQPWVQIAITRSSGQITAREILKAVLDFRRSDLILLEGGPELMGNFFAEKCLDELFLTLAPQVAGRDSSLIRPGFVAGKMFAPEEPLWGTLSSVKQAGSHLFLRYVFDAAA